MNSFSFIFYQVPNSYDFTQTFDLFFKAHHVFNMEYQENIESMMNFLEIFIYEITEQGKQKAGDWMSEVFNSLI